MTRNYHLDLAKGFGILLVVFGHHHTVLNPYIYSFHMPLFFLLSGIFHPSNQTLGAFIRKRARQLLLPYFLFSCILFLIWMLTTQVLGLFGSPEDSVAESFMGIFIGTRIPGISTIVWGGTMWFLPCLFIVGFLYQLLAKYPKKYILFANIIAILINIAFSRFYKERLPWSLLTALMALPLYSFGNLCKSYLISQKTTIHYWLDNALLLLISLSSFLLGPPWGINMASNRYYNVLLFFLGGISGSLLLINLSKLIREEHCKAVHFLGMNTLIILAFHLRAQSVVKVLHRLLFQCEMADDQILYSLAYTLAELIICLPIIYVINRYLPFCLGKKRLQPNKS